MKNRVDIFAYKILFLKEYSIFPKGNILFHDFSHWMEKCLVDSEKV